MCIGESSTDFLEYKGEGFWILCYPCFILSLAGIWNKLLRYYYWKDLEPSRCICLGTLFGLDV